MMFKGSQTLKGIRVRVRGGKGRGRDFLTLTKTLTLVKGWDFCEGKSRVLSEKDSNSVKP